MYEITIGAWHGMAWHGMNPSPKSIILLKIQFIKFGPNTRFLLKIKFSAIILTVKLLVGLVQGSVVVLGSFKVSVNSAARILKNIGAC